MTAHRLWWQVAAFMAAAMFVLGVVVAQILSHHLHGG